MGVERMNANRYLNVVLTVIALLMGLHLGTLWVGAPVDSQLPTMATPVYAQGIPDAGAQRRDMVEQLRKLNIQVEALNNQFKNGQARVRVEAQPAGTR